MAMHRHLQGLATYLLTCKDASSVNPRDVDPKALPHFYILNIERDAAGKTSALRIRFTGTALDTAFRRKLLNCRLEDFVHGPRASEVLAGFHACADSGRALWMRQVVQFQDRLPRFVEGVAVRIPPERIYGGLYVGELAVDEASQFESKEL